MHKYYKIIKILLILSTIGLFMPGLYYDWNVDGATGLSSCGVSTIVGLVGSFLLIRLDDRDKVINISNLILLLMIPVTPILQFLTRFLFWPVEELTFIVDFEYAHSGFYLTVISAIIAAIVYVLDRNVWKHIGGK